MKTGNSLNWYRLKKTVGVLQKQIVTIKTIEDWADAAGVSRRWLYRASKQVYDCTPGEILREARYEAIKQCLRENPELTGYGIALAAGLRDEKALYKFLSTWYDTGLKQLREKTLKEKPGT